MHSRKNRKEQKPKTWSVTDFMTTFVFTWFAPCVNIKILFAFSHSFVNCTYKQLYQLFWGQVIHSTVCRRYLGEESHASMIKENCSKSWKIDVYKVRTSREKTAKWWGINVSMWNSIHLFICKGYVWCGLYTLICRGYACFTVLIFQSFKEGEVQKKNNGQVHPNHSLMLFPLFSEDRRKKVGRKNSHPRRHLWRHC